MGTLGFGEMALIFIAALVLFGPKKLPELGKTVGKALTEFRRARDELKSTFDREMQAIERETASVRDEVNKHVNEINGTVSGSGSTYDHNYYDSHGYGNDAYHDSYESYSHEGSSHTDSSSTLQIANTVSASAPQGADSQSTHALEGTVSTVSHNGHAGTVESHDAKPSEAEPRAVPRGPKAVA